MSKVNNCSLAGTDACRSCTNNPFCGDLQKNTTVSYKNTKQEMSDLISRQEAKKKHCEICRDTNLCYRNFSTCPEVKAFDSISPAERPKGKWLKTDLYPHRIYCSSCYKTYIRNEELLERWEFPMNYCPNCGAEMEREE